MCVLYECIWDFVVAVFIFLLFFAYTRDALVIIEQ